jgi:hypothetical protein
MFKKLNSSQSVLLTPQRPTAVALTLPPQHLLTPTTIAAARAIATITTILI